MNKEQIISKLREIIKLVEQAKTSQVIPIVNELIQEIENERLVHGVKVILTT